MNIQEISLSNLCVSLKDVVLMVLSILIAFWFERGRRPILIMEVAEVGKIQDDQFGRPNARFIKIRVINKRMGKFLGWFFTRESAIGCRARINFRSIEGDDLFGEEMIGRWARSNAPKIQQIDKKIYTVIPGDETIDISVDEPEELDICIKLDGDECYGFNNDSYIKGWKNEDWKINNKKCSVFVRVLTQGLVYKKQFVLSFDNNLDSAKII